MPKQTLVARWLRTIVLCSTLAFAQGTDDKILMFADFEKNEPVSNLGGALSVFGYQQNNTHPAQVTYQLLPKNPKIPSQTLVVNFTIPKENQWAGATVSIPGKADEEGKPIAADMSEYKYIRLQAGAVGCKELRVQLMTEKSNSDLVQITIFPDASLKGFRVPIKEFSVPAWAKNRISAKDTMKAFTGVRISVTELGVTGYFVVDNISFEK